MLSKLLRKKAFLIFIAAIVLLGGYYAYAKARGSSDQVQYVTAPVQRGMIAASVSGSGNMTVGNSANVNAQVSGTVASVNVKPGDNVKKGQVLFTIKNDSLDTNVSKSSASLAQAQSSLDSASASEAQAQSDYDNADGQTGAPASANIQALQAAVNSAQVSLSVAQAQFSTDEAAGCKTTSSSGSSSGSGGSGGAGGSSSSTQNPCPKDQEAIAAAQAQLDQANANLTKAEQANQAAGEAMSADSAKVDAAQSAVGAAQQNVAAAQQDYQDQQNTADERTVTAPIDGTVTAVNVKVGDPAGSGGSGSSSDAGSSGGSGGSGGAGGSGGSDSGSSGTGSSGGSGSSGSGSSSSPAVSIEDLGSLTSTVTVSEVDIPKVSLGQKATLTFDAIDGLSLTGKVTAIDVGGTVSSGVVSYNVTVSLDSGDARIKPGMSVTADIVTAIRQDVLIVPNSAIKSTAGSQYVQVMVNGAPKEQPVTVGLANDTDSEITSGLKEGDTVVAQTINPNAPRSQPSGGGFPGGGRSGGGLGGLGGSGGGMIQRAG